MYKSAKWDLLTNYVDGKLNNLQEQKVRLLLNEDEEAARIYECLVSERKVLSYPKHVKTKQPPGKPSGGAHGELI